MESNINQEESINWREEVEEEEEEQDNGENSGVGRSYECVFCKRGFNTAQALGGHMNIHRRDKARRSTKPTSTNSKRHEQNQFVPGLFQRQIPAAASSYGDQAVNHHIVHHGNQPSLSFSTYFPTSTSSAASRSHFSDDHDQQQPENPLIPDDWRVRLSLDYTPTILEDLEKQRQVMIMRKKEEEVLDLELRLGYDS